MSDNRMTDTRTLPNANGSWGVDLSMWNRGTNLAKISGLDFVIAKATEGDTYDGCYDDFSQQAYNLKVPFGGYHYYRPQVSYADQADAINEYANPRPNLAFWIDYEKYGATPIADSVNISRIINRVNSKHPQFRIGLYLNSVGLARLAPYIPQMPVTTLWYASLDGNVAPQTKPIGWNINQYRSLDGIDRDYCADAPALWRKHWSW